VSSKGEKFGKINQTKMWYQRQVGEWFFGNALMIFSTSSFYHMVLFWILLK